MAQIKFRQGRKSIGVIHGMKLGHKRCMPGNMGLGLTLPEFRQGHICVIICHPWHIIAAWSCIFAYCHGMKFQQGHIYFTVCHGLTIVHGHIYLTLGHGICLRQGHKTFNLCHGMSTRHGHISLTLCHGM